MTIVTRQLLRQFKPVAWEKSFRVQRAPRIYLPMKQLLIQGADPYDQDVHDRNAKFQGGYRCTLKIVTQPGIGRVEIGWDHLGFEYIPKNPAWSGHDSFSYSIVSYLGQESDACCIHVFL